VSFRHRFVRFLILVGVSPLLGAFVGLVGTVYHSALFPLGLSLSVVLVATFLAGLRALWRTRLLALAGALGVVGVVVFAAGADLTGSVLIMADPAGLSFVIAVTFVTVVALAWPRFSARPTSYDRDAGIPERTLPQ
jgi:N-acetyl-1-D-myo-inositol-2-amino-2-deoxy-alpha-D-glucopyranoside deacetylase